MQAKNSTDTARITHAACDHAIIMHAATTVIMHAAIIRSFHACSNNSLYCEHACLLYKLLYYVTSIKFAHFSIQGSPVSLVYINYHLHAINNMV